MLRGQSAVVWFGWGSIEASVDDEEAQTPMPSDSVGTGEFVMILLMCI